MKAIVENTPRITIKQLRDHPDWPQFVAAGAVDLTVEAGKDTRAVRVELESDSMPRGGERFWLRCPRCSALRYYLVWINDRLLCRGPACHHLYYFSQTLPDSSVRIDLLPILKAWNRCRKRASSSTRLSPPPM